MIRVFLFNLIPKETVLTGASSLHIQNWAGNCFHSFVALQEESFILFPIGPQQARLNPAHDLLHILELPQSSHHFATEGDNWVRQPLGLPRMHYAVIVYLNNLFVCEVLTCAITVCC